MSTRAVGKWLAGAVFVAVAAAVVATDSDYGLTIDEHVALKVNQRLIEFLTGDVGPLTDRPDLAGGDRPFPERMLRHYWIFSTFENRHLPVYALGAVGCRLAALGRLEPLEAYRLWPALIFALAAAALAAALASQAGWLAGLAAAAALVLTPRVFAHAHFIAPETTLSSLVLLAVLAFWRWGNSWARAWSFALLLALALATKMTAFVFPLPVAVWLVAYRRWGHLRAVLMALVLTPALVIGLVPVWWSDPIGRFVHFVRDLGDPAHDIATYYMGQVYPRSAPWHSPWVVTALTVPAAILGAALVGLVACLGLGRRADLVGLCLLCAGAMLGVKSLPNTPGHDVERLFLVAFYFLAPAAGLGVGVVFQAVARIRWIGSAAAAALAVAWTVAAGRELVRYHPYELSYYNELAGGLKGAADRWGMEITYWYEIVTPAVLADLDCALPPGARVWGFPYYAGYQWQQAHGRIDPTIRWINQPGADYLILLSRLAWVEPVPFMRDLYRHGQPLWSLRHDGVQLLGLYRLRAPALAPPAGEADN